MCYRRLAHWHSYPRSVVSRHRGAGLRIATLLPAPSRGGAVPRGCPNVLVLLGTGGFSREAMGHSGPGHLQGWERDEGTCFLPDRQHPEKQQLRTSQAEEFKAECDL